MDILKTYLKCSVCDGTGVFETTSGNQPDTIDPCPACKGEGYIETGKIDGYDQFKDIQDKQNDILDKLDDILEKLSE